MASDPVLRYYDLNRNWRRCVVHQPARADRAQQAAACGPQPVPPTNLAQFWAARDDWNACATPLTAKHWKVARVAARCGPKPSASDYGVPRNPYST